jgi:uncharacterized membrane protein (DUF373 family)
MENLLNKLLESGTRALEYGIALATLTVAAVMGLHLLSLCWDLVCHFNRENALPIKSIVIEAMNILIILEILAIFVRLESKHQVGIALLMDMAILFSIRETVLGLYADSPTVWTAELSAALFVGLRVLYSGYKRTRPKPKQAT